LSKSKGQAFKISCVNNLRQLQLSMRMYLDENQGAFPPRPRSDFWPSRIYDGYKNLKLLICPKDGPNPQSWPGDEPGKYPADGAPRSYICNYWNDYFANALSADDLTKYLNGVLTNAVMKESAIPRPSATVILGEKMATSYHYHLDLLEYEPGSKLQGNDLFQLDRSRHNGDNQINSGAGGSNYSYADGSVRFVKFGNILWPENQWALNDENRKLYAVPPQ
jgi:prepilin-type processing-associated H-X9-DG protein